VLRIVFDPGLDVSFMFVHHVLVSHRYRSRFPILDGTLTVKLTSFVDLSHFLQILTFDVSLTFDVTPQKTPDFDVDV